MQWYFKAMRVLVRTLQTVIRASQATISERASRAARLCRANDDSTDFTGTCNAAGRCSSTREKAMHVQTRRMHWAIKANSSVGSHFETKYKIRK